MRTQLGTPYEQGRNGMKEDILKLIEKYGENVYLKDLVLLIRNLK